MNTHEINQILRKLKPFVGTFACDSCPSVKKRPAGLVINTDPTNEKGEHWVALWLLENGTGEYFDSFGFPPLVPEIQTYINMECPQGFKYNNKTLQHPMTNTCGPFSIAFIIAKTEGEEFGFFISKFSFDLEKNEDLLTRTLQTWISRSKNLCGKKKRASMRK